MPTYDTKQQVRRDTCMKACMEKTKTADNYGDFVDYGSCSKSPSGLHVYDTNRFRTDIYICWFCKESDHEFWGVVQTHG